MANITYLLGAGASANSLPVITNFEDRLVLFLKHLKSLTGYINWPMEEVKLELPTLISDLEWLIKEVGSHQTIDTLAKKFFHQSNKSDNLLKLKALLITFFAYEQTQPKLYFDPNDEETGKFSKESTDKRYDSFIASILKNEVGKIELSDNVKILTWNYDVQFELAYRNYENDYMFNIQRIIQSIPNRTSVKNDLTGIDLNKFAVVKLNGVALYDYVELENNYRTIFDKDINSNGNYFSKIISLIKAYDVLSNSKDKCQLVKLFNYSWESNAGFTEKHSSYDDLQEVAKKIASNTDVLVVIGYSFPFFNREIDRKIMQNLKYACKIYIQDLEANDRIEHFNSIFPSLKDYPPTPVNSVRSFFLPSEL